MELNQKHNSKVLSVRLNTCPNCTTSKSEIN